MRLETLGCGLSDLRIADCGLQARGWLASAAGLAESVAGLAGAAGWLAAWAASWAGLGVGLADEFDVEDELGLGGDVGALAAGRRRRAGRG